MPTYDRNRFNHYSDNPYDAVPYGPRLRRNDNNNRSRTVLNHRRNLPPTTIQNRYHSDAYDHQNSNNYRHSLNASNHHHHHQQQQQIVPFYNSVERHDAVMNWEGFDLSDQYPVAVSRGYHLQSEETMIVSNGEFQFQGWYDEYHTFALVDHIHYLDETVELEQSRSNNEAGLSEEGISKCLKLKTKGDDSEEEGICVICQEDLFPHEEEQEEEDNDKEKVAAISPCGHEYHYDCVAKWLQQKNLCPLCKATPRLDF